MIHTRTAQTVLINGGIARMEGRHLACPPHSSEFRGYL
jgi:hypothetical protein